MQVVINSTNPRLYWYSRPFLLAIIIAVLTFVLGFIVFLVGMSSKTCTTSEKISTYSGHMGSQEIFVRQSRCENNNPPTKGCTSQTCVRSIEKLRGDAVGGGRVHVELQKCNPPDEFFEGKDMPQALDKGTWIPETGKVYVAGDPDREAVPMCKEYSEDWPELWLKNGWYSGTPPSCSISDPLVGVYEIKETMCISRGFGAALADALAYASYIEVVVSAMVVLTLLKMGRVTLKDQSQGIWGAVWGTANEGGNATGALQDAAGTVASDVIGVENPLGGDDEESENKKEKETGTGKQPTLAQLATRVAALEASFSISTAV